MREGEWYHVCIVEPEGRLYVNGVRVPHHLWGRFRMHVGRDRKSGLWTFTAWVKPTAVAFRIWYWLAYELGCLWRQFWGSVDQ